MLEASIIGVSYALGTLNGAYYFVRLHTGHDIRTLGSGTAGARNAGRALGRSAFVSVFLWDVLKGAAAVGMARMAGVDPAVVGGAMVAVTAGHIWPLQLRFRGGKGLATSFGALLAFGYPVIVAGVLFLALTYALIRRVETSVFVALAFLPFAALWWWGWRAEVGATAVVVSLVLFAHLHERKSLAAPRSSTVESSSIEAP